jgi:hypothetical protein
LATTVVSLADDTKENQGHRLSTGTMRVSRRQRVKAGTWEEVVAQLCLMQKLIVEDREGLPV